ncbi:DNA cytosine methyltransferase [Mycoplasma sp. Ms02]|uniref:DNA cytosine methyltransferase n=1 Tax=Mycoplasma sp. Ms02 TaxID=353851 RepID=UPI001C8A611F|nr:DNA cytosine methyltransferase [Mycoplasma sp. Ms02]QZE12233.1 DNA cytosine methyltransferase [Mycoplasma sp. Ms02]
MNNRYKTIDLFAGLGGIRRGFEKTGKFQNLLSAEIDKYACFSLWISLWRKSL